MHCFIFPIYDGGDILEIINVLIEIFQQDDKKFIFALYREMLNRQPRQGELDYYLNKISTGTSKMTVLEDILKSHEIFLLYNRPQKTSVIDRRNTVTNTLRRIFNLDSIHFVKELYRQLLCREADRNGFKDHVSFLIREKTMDGKFTVFKNILMSEEALNLLLSSQNVKDVPNILNGEFKPLAIQNKNIQKTVNNISINSSVLSKKVSIIILTWNGLEYTKNCLQSLKKTIRNQPVDVVVFDNGSTDGTIEYLQSLHWIKPIFNNQNIGFTAGNNKTLQFCDKNSDIVLLNNDMIIEQENWLPLLQETALSDSKIGIVGTRLCGTGTDSGKLMHAGTYIYPDDLMGQQIGGLEIDVNQYSAIRDVQGIVFACAYIKREIIEKIGFLDTDYFAYFEDTDYCLRAILNGYRVVLDGRITLKHVHNGATKTNNVNFWNIYSPSQLKFKRKWKDFLISQYEFSVNWHSISDLPFFGYSNSSRNIMYALDEQKVDVRYKFVYGEGTPIPFEESSKMKDHRINLFRQRAYDPTAPEVIYGQGDVFFKNTGRYKIGFTMLEVDGLPAEWVRQCNMMNEIWVPSQFNAETFRQSGVHVPIHIIPLGVDANYFNPEIIGTRFSDKFTFLSVLEWGERKAPEDLIKTFVKEFANHDDVILVCKINNNDPSINIQQEIQKLGLRNIESKVLILHNKIIPGYLMGSLYRSADCFILPTRGEGWGMPILEAMACGIPTIATDWSAQRAFLNEHTGYPVKVKKVVPAVARCPYYHGFNWAEPDFDHLAYQMRYVYENQREAKQKSVKTAKELLETWTWDRTASEIKKRLKTING
jgi:GT2 family glycosyltransferase/glycosyltransferase involved in cell wall biosynthesis